MKIRNIVYRFSYCCIFVLAACITIFVYQTDSIRDILKDQSTMVNVAVTLAGFLFTGQGIILTLSPENRFIRLVMKFGYMKDFHKLCRWAEILFIVSILLSIDAFSSNVLDLLYFFVFVSALLYALWALSLFSRLVKHYIDSDVNNF